MQTHAIHPSGVLVVVTTTREHHHAGDYFETTAFTHRHDDAPKLVTFVDGNGVAVQAYAIATTEEEATEQHQRFVNAAR